MTHTCCKCKKELESTVIFSEDIKDIICDDCYELINNY